MTPKKTAMWMITNGRDLWRFIYALTENHIKRGQYCLGWHIFLWWINLHILSSPATVYVLTMILSIHHMGGSQEHHGRISVTSWVDLRNIFAAISFWLNFLKTKWICGLRVSLFGREKGNILSRYSINPPWTVSGSAPSSL